MLGTVTNADTYLSENTAWQALSEAEKTSLLKQANVVLGLFNWKGARSASDQVDIWPRYGVVVDGYQVPSDTVPENITDALYELCGFGLVLLRSFLRIGFFVHGFTFKEKGPRG